MKIMFLGTSSGAGKTLFSALFCRHLSRKGIDTVPFKASNLSSSSAIVPGGEIGIGQVFQAAACGKAPSGDMNPVLLKYADGRIAVLVRGATAEHTSPDDLSKEACLSFDRLCREHDAVVCEGSGSPAELNMRDRDIANIRMCRERDIPAVIVGDIEKGGVFAAIYGTWLLAAEEDRHLLKGFIINRFRGEPSVLRTGIERLEELTGMKCFGILPFCDLSFPEEDLLSIRSGPMDDKKMLDNLDLMLEMIKASADLSGLESVAADTV